MLDGEPGRLAGIAAGLQDQARGLASNRFVQVGVGSYLAYSAYCLLFQPLKHVRRNPEVGYITEERQSSLERAMDVRRRRQTGDLPPVYPNGWFCIMPAHELPAKGVKQAHVLGLDIAVFRTESGKVGAVGAYCPHLGANLAAGGTVEGESIKCPFHGWEYNCEGTCTRIPYAKDPTKIPADARVTKYTVLEINDQILLWHDAEGREPTWMPPELPHVQGKRWSFRGKTQHFINAHIQEVPENAADVAHLNYLHGPVLLNGTDLRYTDSRFRFVRHEWDASWAPEKEPGREHLSVLHLTHRITVLGVRLPIMDFHVTATQVGPGLVYLTWVSPFGEGVFIQSLTPQEPLLQELSHCIYADWKVPTFVSKFYLFGEALQVERDVMVWNNKMYRSKPMLVAEDSLIAQHRRWYKQFYSEHSPRLEDLNRGSLEW